MGGDIYIPPKPKPKPKPKPEYKYALWYFKPYDGNYEAFSSAGSPEELKNIGFTHAIALHSPAKDKNRNLKYGNIPFSGDKYENGHKDGKSFGRWIDSILNGIDYLVVIPVLIEEGKLKEGVRGIEYWKGWIDGVCNNTGNYLKGFYWYLEYPWQIHDNIVSEDDIREISDYIKKKRLQFIWIPYVHDGIDPDKTDIKVLPTISPIIIKEKHRI